MSGNIFKFKPGKFWAFTKAFPSVIQKRFTHNWDLNYHNCQAQSSPKNKISFLVKVTSQNYSFVLTHLFRLNVENSGSFSLAKLSLINVYMNIGPKLLLSKQTLSSLIEVILYSTKKLLWVNSFDNVNRKIHLLRK